MAKLTAGTRNAMPASEFGMPSKRAYPLPDKSHAANAKARATQMVAKGKLSAKAAAMIRAKANRMIMGCILMLAILGAQANAAVTSLQVTIGASTTHVATVNTYCLWVVFQNNSTHTMRIGDSTTTSSKGIMLVAGGSSFYQGPKPTGGATNLANWWVAGTQNDVLDVACDGMTF